jgi:hypothetical protein
VHHNQARHDHLHSPTFQKSTNSYAEEFPGLPPAEDFIEGVTARNHAEFVFVYDFACGAFASLKARLRRLTEMKKEVPVAARSWLSSCKWLVDKFHFKSHVGAASEITKFPAFNVMRTVYSPVKWWQSE